MTTFSFSAAGGLTGSWALTSLLMRETLLDIYFCLVEAERTRAMMLSASTAKVRISAPVQASFCCSA